jgi:outer membrane receptor for Fe3+-dicitrate
MTRALQHRGSACGWRCGPRRCASAKQPERGPRACNQLRGTVWELGYLGNRSTYQHQDDQRQVVTVFSQNERRTSEWSIDWSDEVFVSWSADAAVVLQVSVSAYTQEDMDQKGMKDFTDIVRFTPGVSIDQTGTNAISIRGISSSGGAGTTGIYIDDTPIQMRSLGFNPDDTLPKTFDLERVEVLRGPQGTLFGAGSEGGTVRYILTQPSLTTDSTYARSEAVVHAVWRAKLRGRRRARRADHRRYAWLPRQYLVSA